MKLYLWTLIWVLNLALPWVISMLNDVFHFVS